MILAASTLGSVGAALIATGIPLAAVSLRYRRYAGLVRDNPARPEEIEHLRSQIDMRLVRRFFGRNGDRYHDLLIRQNWRFSRTRSIGYALSGGALIIVGTALLVVAAG